MSDTARRVLFSCLIILVVVCLCLSTVAFAGALGLLFTRMDKPNLLIPDIPVETKQTITPEPIVEMTEEEIQKKMDEIQEQVVQLRGLEAKGSFSRALLTPDELRNHVINDFLKEYTPEEAKQDTLALAAFGMLPADFELHNFLLELYSEQIAGFYDRDTKEMFVVQDESFSGPERLTYAHEYIHTLQDQNYDIENGLNYSEEACEEDSERCAAIQALLEGDASLAEITWLRSYASTKERNEIINFYQKLESPIYENAPEYMKADFLFPYEQGLTFVQSLYDKGGWAAVHEAYQNLPVSTEQILHPERYPDDTPQLISIPDLESILGEGWEEISQGVWGEWYTFLLLNSGIEEGYRLPEKQAQRAAEGWDGDVYSVMYNEENNYTVLVLVTIWDTEKDAREFSNAFEKYGNERFGGSADKLNETFTWESTQSVSTFSLSGFQTTWIMAPDLNFLQQLNDLMEGSLDAP